MFNQIEYQNEYNKKNLDRITVTVPKGQKEIIRQHAEAKGMKLNTYIKHLIDEDLKLSGGGRIVRLLDAVLKIVSHRPVYQLPQ